MDYARGKQIVLFDPRLRPPHEFDDPTRHSAWNGLMMVPPKCWFAYTVVPSKDKASDLFAMVAGMVSVSGILGGGKFDALHIMAHGAPGYVQLGRPGLKDANAGMLAKIENMFRYVVFHGCLVGKPPPFSDAFMIQNTISGSGFARKVAAYTGARVVAAREEQHYFIQKHPDDPWMGFVDFGDWEGPVDIYEKNQPVQSYQVNPIDPKFDLEKTIFPSKGN